MVGVVVPRYDEIITNMYFVNQLNRTCMVQLSKTVLLENLAGQFDISLLLLKITDAYFAILIHKTVPIPIYVHSCFE